MKTLMFIFLFLPFSVFAETLYGDPMTICLNDYVIPKLATTTTAKQLTDDAFSSCKSQVDDWLKPFEVINKKEESYKSMHDFYIRMIETRRKAEKNNIKN